MRRVSVLLLLLSVGCRAQSIPAQTQERIQQQVRAHYSIPPDVSVDVGSPGPSDFPDYSTVPVTMTRDGKAQKLEFLLSKDGKTLLRLTKIDLTVDLFAENASKIDIKGRPVRGNPNAKVTIVNFDDFECPFCSRMHATLMSQILPQYGDRIRIIYKDYPLPMHAWAPHAANNANCLAKEDAAAYWDLADYLHANQRAIGGGSGDLQKAYADLDRMTVDIGKKHGVDGDRLQACVKAQSDAVLKASMDEGDKLGITATPTMYINGEKVEGALELGEMRAAIDERLKAAGVQPPPPVAAPAQPAFSN